MVFLGNPEFGCELQPIDFVAFAKACGGTGIAIENPVDCERILDRALATPGPVIVEAIDQLQRERAVIVYCYDYQ